MEPNPEEKSFHRWKRMRGLPDEFPYLPPIKGDEFDLKFYADSSRENIIEQILRADAPCTAVLIEKGQGCTTLMGFANFLLSYIGLEEPQRRKLAKKILHQDKWRSLDEILKELQKNRVSVAPLIDMSSPLVYTSWAEYESEVRIAVNTMRDVKTGRGAQDPALSMAINEIYFVSPEGFEVVQNEWPRDYRIFRFPPYRNDEIYAMLTQHYGQHVRSAVNPDVIKDGPSRPIKDTIADLRKSLVDLARKEAPYH
ncbi:MAG: hypothetical protein HYW26_03655 [Candidatus Aenigmarchaeota archaeon]|nr:hypothetical protein [Candidatus Aenigmarchaeota archaeon]